MHNTPDLFVMSSGTLTSVGMDTAMTLASVRAGINTYQESSCLNKDLNPMKVSSIPEGAFEIPEVQSNNPLYQQVRLQRMLGIGVHALEEVMSDYTLENPLPLFLGGPEIKPLNQPVIDADFLSHLVALSGANLDLQQSRLMATGHPSGIQAIELAFRYCQQTGNKHVLIGGVDSLIDLHAMGAFDSDERMSAYNVADGFVPGEAAGFLLLSTEQGLTDFQNNAIGRISYPGLAREKGHRYSSAPYLGEGLAHAVTESLRKFNGPKINTIFSGMNGESLAVKEHGVAMTRNHQALNETLDIQHPIDCFGDIGAALAPVLIGLGLTGMQTGAYQSPALVYCSAEEEIRAACCIQSVA
jgi:3-oxoacyl-[acyl-carrier-protein] synthase I